MRRHVPTLALGLLVLAHLDWARLALAGGLATGGVMLLSEAVAFAALAVALLRRARGLAIVALLLAAAVEVGGIFALGVRGVGLAANLGIIAGILLCANAARAAASPALFRPGALVVAAGFVAYVGASLVAGETFLLLGLVLALAGWSLLSWAGLTHAAPRAEPSRTGSAPPAGDGT